MTIGTVKWFDQTKGFGFIAPEDGTKDVFAHISAIAAGAELRDDDKVEFDTVPGNKGPQAANIRLV
jgi:CspA family cold shock protein